MVEKLAYSMNHNMSTKNLIHLQAGGRTGPLLLRGRILCGPRCGNARAFPRASAPLLGFESLRCVSLAELESLRGKQKREGCMAPRVRVEGWVIRGSNPGPWD